MVLGERAIVQSLPTQSIEPFKSVELLPKFVPKRIVAKSKSVFRITA